VEPDVHFREGTAADLEATFALSRRVAGRTAARNEMLPDLAPTSTDSIHATWLERRELIGFLAAQPDGRYWIAESADTMEPVGYARVVRFDGFEELTDLEVDRTFQGRGLGRGLLERCWPGAPSPELSRVVVANGTPTALTLFSDFGVMPVAGHWRLRQRTEAYVQQRSRELADGGEAPVSMLEHDRAVAEWKRLEPAALGHPRPALHDFFGRDRTCLAVVDEERGGATGLCWVSAVGEVGPAVGERPEDLVPVVLGALDRVARAQEPEHLVVYASSIAWWLLRRLRALGFVVHLPAWIMCSEPIPGLDRYTPTQPTELL
jgi:GNAT superfamily N-acetyltransferase